MSRRCLQSNVINNTITEAIDNFERVGNHLRMKAGMMASWKGIPETWTASLTFQQDVLSSNTLVRLGLLYIFGNLQNSMYKMHNEKCQVLHKWLHISQTEGLGGVCAGGWVKTLNFKKVFFFSSFVIRSYRNVLCVFLRGTRFHQLQKTGNLF